MKIKSIIYLLIISSLMLFIAGCTYDIDLGIEGILRIRLNKDYTADTEIDVLINSSVLNIIGLAFNPLEELRGEFESQGYKTEIYVHGQKTGLYAYKHITDLEDLSIMAYNVLEYGQIKPSDNIHISTEKTLIYDIHTIRTNFDLLSQIGDFNIFTQIPINSIINQMNLKFILDLPISVDEHNASRASEDNRILEWDIVPTMNNLIELRLKVINIERLILFIIFVISLILIIFLMRKTSRKV